MRVFKNRKLKRIFGPKRMRKGSGDTSILKTKNFNYLHLLQNIFRVIGSWKLKWFNNNLERYENFKILTSKHTVKRPLKGLFAEERMLIIWYQNEKLI